MFILKMTVHKEQSQLVLLNDAQEIDIREWPEERDMGRRLFEAMETLLKEHELEPPDIAEFRVESDLPDHSTSRRIAEAVQRVYTFGVGFNKET